MGTQNTSTYGIAASVIIALALSTTNVWAQGSKSQPSSASSAPAQQGAKKDDKVDISDLENKYWAPKDTDFSVVQNRTYTKENRWFLTGQYGIPVNDQWGAGNSLGISANYFWSERMGVQATYLKSSIHNNDASDFIAANFGSGIRPDYNRMNTYYGLGYNLVPFYAKMSFWGKKIMYFDMAITPTIGYTKYDQVLETGLRTKGNFTYGVDVSQFFFFSSHAALRFDLKNQWTKEEIARFHTSKGIVTGGKVQDQNQQDTLFLMGVTFYY
jgi:outer membrane beta-barrel protein